MLLVGQKATGVHAEVTGNDSVKVTWVAPTDPKGTIKNYIIQAAAVGEEQKNFTVEPQPLSATINTLTPFKEYNITVVTVNDQLNGNGGGPGEPSDPVKAKTWPAGTP